MANWVTRMFSRAAVAPSPEAVATNTAIDAANSVGISAPLTEQWSALKTFASAAPGKSWEFISGAGGAAGGVLGKMGRFAGHLVVQPLRLATKFATNHPGWSLLIAGTAVFTGYKAYQNRKEARQASALQVATADVRAETAALRQAGQLNHYPDHPANSAGNRWGQLAESRLQPEAPASLQSSMAR